jgi:hypothetical protein
MASLLQKTVTTLGERSGEAVGSLYARVAGSIQRRLERIEDLAAERRFQRRQRHTHGELPAQPAAPQLATNAEGNVSLRTGSV